jgi:hypothetical protein
MDAPPNGATGRGCGVQSWNDATSNSGHGQDLDYPGKEGAAASLIEDLDDFIVVDDGDDEPVPYSKDGR